MKKLIFIFLILVICGCSALQKKVSSGSDNCGLFSPTENIWIEGPKKLPVVKALENSVLTYSFYESKELLVQARTLSNGELRIDIHGIKGIKLGKAAKVLASLGTISGNFVDLGISGTELKFVCNHSSFEKIK